MTDNAIQLTVFSSMDHNDEASFHHQYLFLTEKLLYLSHCIGEVLHRYFLRLFCVIHLAFSATPLCKLFYSQVADESHNHRFFNPVAPHSSLVMIGWSFQISASTLSLFSIVAAVAGQLLQGLSPMSFSLLVQ